MFKINDGGSNVEVYPTFGLDLIIDSECENLPMPSFDEVMMESNDDEMMDLDSFDPLETAISVLGMNGSAEKSTPNKPRIGPASFKKKLVEEKAVKDPLADDPVEEKKPTPRIGPASFKKKLEQDSPLTEAKTKPISPFDMLRNTMKQESSTPKAGPASFKRKLEETPILPSRSPPEKPTARVGPASFKRKMEESSTTQPSPPATAPTPRIGPASFKKKIESNSSSPMQSPTEEKKVTRVGPARFKRQLEESKDSGKSSKSRSPSPVKISTPEKSVPKAGPARFKRKLEEKSADSDDDVSHISRTSSTSLKGSDVGSESAKAAEKPPYRPGPARFRKPVKEEIKIESDDDEKESSKPTRGLDSSNIYSLTLGVIPIKKGGAIATKRKSRSPADSSESVVCQSCNITLPSMSALRVHDRATHKPVRIAQHLKVKSLPRAIMRVNRPRYCEDSDEDEMLAKTVPGESLKCYQCLKTIAEDDYIEHLVAHDQEAQAELDTKNSTAELSKGAKLSRRYVFADVNDERNKADDAVLRCFLCTDHLFLNRADYKHHTQTKHCIIMDNNDGESD